MKIQCSTFGLVQVNYVSQIYGKRMKETELVKKIY